MLNNHIPDDFCENLTNLQTLNLARNRFVNIPDNIGLLTNLSKLIMNSNQLDCEIPESITMIKNLNFLILQDNQLFGEIPKTLFQLMQNKYEN